MLLLAGGLVGLMFGNVILFLFLSLLLYLLFSIKQNILLWPTGMISAILYMAVFYQSKFYADMGLNDYISSVDCMIMGRKCMEKISSFKLTPEQWPYGDTRIVVLSSTVKEAPDNLKGKVEMYSDEIPALITQLENEGYQHAYVDGGFDDDDGSGALYARVGVAWQISIFQVGLDYRAVAGSDIDFDNADVDDVDYQMVSLIIGLSF